MLKYAEPPLFEAGPDRKFAPTGQLDSLRRNYLFHDDPAVSEFLEKHPLVASKLFEAYEHIGVTWGKHARVKLDLISDPDESAADGILASIETTDDVDAAFMKLGHFKVNWWAQASIDVKGKLGFTVEWPDSV